MAARKRGSLTDTVTLEEFPFFFEPKMKDKSTTMYGKQHIVGHRLPDYIWVGNGESHVELDVFILKVTDQDVRSMVNQFKQLLESQDDLGAPHPVYINVGMMYVGKKFVLVDFESEVEVFEYPEAMLPHELKIKMKFEEIPSDGRFAGAGQ